MAIKKYKTPEQERKAKNKQITKYHNRAMKAFTFRFHKVSDSEVIATIKSKENKNDYIRQLILDDIKKGQ